MAGVSNVVYHLSEMSMPPITIFTFFMSILKLAPCCRSILMAYVHYTDVCKTKSILHLIHGFNGNLW